MRKKLKVVITNHRIYSPQMNRLQETYGINGLKKYISNSQQIIICYSLARGMSTCSWYSRNCSVTHEILTIILFMSPVNMSSTTKFISLSRLDVSELSWVPSWLLLLQLQLDLISVFTNFWNWERIYFHYSFNFLEKDVNFSGSPVHKSSISFWVNKKLHRLFIISVIPIFIANDYTAVNRKSIAMEPSRQEVTV